MIYVGHLFRWKPDDESMLIIARRWDYQWCRLWSDKSFAEMSEFFNNIRGRPWHWRQDGNSLPYYLLTPEMRRRALGKGAIIKDWNNPQLPTGTKPTYREKRYIEKERETIAYQHQTEGGTVSLLTSEADILAAASLLRNQPDTANDGHLPDQGDPDPSHQAPSAVPMRGDDIHGDVPQLPPMGGDAR